MSATTHSFKEKIRLSFSLAEKHSWIFYLIILTLVVPIRFGWIQAQDNVLDIIIAITITSIISQAINKMRHKDNDSKPFIRCMKCNAKIEPTGIWKCNNMIAGKTCGWLCDFPK